MREKILVCDKENPKVSLTINQTQMFSIDISMRALLKRWAIFVLICSAYVGFLRIIGLDNQFDFRLLLNLVSTGTLILFILRIYGAPRK